MKGLAAAALFLTIGVLGAWSNSAAQVFHDDFDWATVDTSRWDVSGYGLVSVANGRLHLAPDGCLYPFLVTKHNPFPPSGDYLCRVGFRYTSVQRGGNGFGTMDGSRGMWSGGFVLWQDSGHGLATEFGDIGRLMPLSGGNPDLNDHVFEWRYEDGVYSFSLDGRKLGESRSARTSDRLFLGHEAYCFSEPWSTSECDFVHIEWLNQPVSGRPTTWGTVKGAYR